jgi:hypothetical protein
MLYNKQWPLFMIQATFYFIKQTLTREKCNGQVSYFLGVCEEEWKKAPQCRAAVAQCASDDDCLYNIFFASRTNSHLAYRRNSIRPYLWLIFEFYVYIIMFRTHKIKFPKSRIRSLLMQLNFIVEQKKNV